MCKLINYCSVFTIYILLFSSCGIQKEINNEWYQSTVNFQKVDTQFKGYQIGVKIIDDNAIVEIFGKEMHEIYKLSKSVLSDKATFISDVNDSRFNNAELIIEHHDKADLSKIIVSFIDKTNGIKILEQELSI
ncbi:hypothetical protein [Flammeovirga kamogawensis]|uniref:Uncharacterized protein n=1 Tax=Flammeovirga kamogawensis TaxID=373891 RepID=A0ABX8GU61_9BACT|nr:hypothetical protein [Flammeovirga kamogawensis]MBB6459806.1 hypothetical protein [Flammeovirga kamogawensis]QWG07138.1 hypothetical protein KM029_17830 [Flammeovirga kamogawensis]TRX68960.1 hypothetical protein EO216_12820 [Flammeovirga kamogawensis]